MKVEQTKYYVLGFLFNRTGTEVLLIHKRRPDWQRNKFNGIGGHIEEGETPEAAMARECHEESGLQLDDWQPVCVLSGKGFEVHVFMAHEEFIGLAMSASDEPIDSFQITNLPYAVIPNVRWLIPMCLSLSRGETCKSFQIVEQY